MKLSKRETTLATITLSAIIIGLTFLIGEPQIKKWHQLSEEKELLRNQIEKSEMIISRKESFQSELEALQKQIPKFESKRQTTPELLRGIKTIANKNSLKLPRIQPGKETQTGDLYELNVMCSWEGSLDSLTHFLFDLQSAGSRYDVAQINISPVSSDTLKGNLEIACAYYRDASEN